MANKKIQSPFSIHSLKTLPATFYHVVGLKKEGCFRSNEKESQC